MSEENDFDTAGPKHRAWHSLKSQDLATRDLYRLLISSVVPRPIAFISTQSASGVNNLAPFSFFSGVSSNPPCLVASISRKPGGEKKDTLINLEETKQCVVNVVSEWFVKSMVDCAAAYPYGVDEMEKVGLTALKSSQVVAPRVKESAIQMECELYDSMRIGDSEAGSSTLVVLKVLEFHLSDAVYSEGRVDFDALKPVGRMGGHAYARVREFFDLIVPAPG